MFTFMEVLLTYIRTLRSTVSCAK